jgi:hypothetical protein
MMIKKNFSRKWIILFWLILAFANTIYTQPGLPDYNIVWETASPNASASMPCGGGDIGMNVWVENDELFIYLSRSGNFDEQNTLLKSGRIRLQLDPNIFIGGKIKQELHLKEGSVTVEGNKNGISAKVKIWADVFNPVVHVEIGSSQKIKATAIYENWRYQNRMVKAREHFANSWKWAAPKNTIYKKDSIRFQQNQILFYHYNDAKTIFDTTVQQQGLFAIKNQLYNPLKNLAFGGALEGANFIPAGTTTGTYANTDYQGWILQSKKAVQQQSLILVFHNAQVADINDWQKELETKNHNLPDPGKALNKTLLWWADFWKRSFIEIGTGRKDSAWEVGRNYQLFRYMLACNAKSSWPTKFNGGLFTVDPVYTDTAMQLTPDYRNWGGGVHTAQNQRLVYFPMIKSGDWDGMQAQFDFYLRILKNAELRSWQYWNHGGACFTEQMENYGLPNFAEYGQKRPAGFDKGVEFNAWLEYEWDTVLEFCLMMLEEQRYTNKDISDKIAFIKSCLHFFDAHYQYLAKQRGIKALDGNGKLILYPGSGAETYKMAHNASSTIAALQTVTDRLLALPDNYLSVPERKQLDSFRNRIPPLPYTSFNGLVTIAPAKSWERINNIESPQLYPVFPWRIFGVGKPGLDTAIHTFYKDTNVVKFRSPVGWKQDNIWAASLGLTNEAWQLTAYKLKNGPRRFPAFWGPGFDWVPDHNWGGSGMLGLQEMLLQTDDKRIMIFPAWPKNLDVHFKLHAPYQTTVEATLKNGKIISLIVEPAERKKDVAIWKWMVE